MHDGRRLACLYGLWRSLVSASVWGTEGRGFKSRQPDGVTTVSTIDVKTRPKHPDDINVGVAPFQVAVTPCRR